MTRTPIVPNCRPHTARRTRSAFTLIELLLVLVILGVLMAIVVPKFTNRSQDARITAAKTDIRMIEGALGTFEVDNGRFPTSEEGLQALIAQPTNATNWKGPYIKRDMPKDPWGNPYIYRYPGEHNPGDFDLSSHGPDGREGNDDITNWSK